MKRGTKFRPGQRARVNQGPGEGTVVIIVDRIYHSHWATNTVQKEDGDGTPYLMDEDWMDLLPPRREATDARD